MERTREEELQNAKVMASQMNLDDLMDALVNEGMAKERNFQNGFNIKETTLRNELIGIIKREIKSRK